MLHIIIIRLTVRCGWQEYHLLLHTLFIEFIAVGILAFLLKNYSFHKQINIFVPIMFTQSKAFYIVRKNAGIWVIEIFNYTTIVIYAENIAVF